MVKICVVGCLHGELDRVYQDIAATEQAYDFKTDLVLCCGDFQTIRNPADLESMSVPQKYRTMGDFWRYYAGTVHAPILTLFVGGNHEASNYLQELPYGGWVAPNIYYMGYSNVLQFGGLRIAGLSGIYKSHDYPRGHFERPPYTEQSKRSVYHTRNIDVFRLSQVRRPVDIVLSHDWPRGIYHYGDVGQLLRRKTHFTEEVQYNSLGSEESERLLCRLQPRYWFAAHMHVKFSALVKHQNCETRFLALDKCLPRRDYLQFVDVEPVADPICRPVSTTSKSSSSSSSEGDEMEDQSSKEEKSIKSQSPGVLSLDPEWLCVLHSTNHLFSLDPIHVLMPTSQSRDRYDFTVTDDEIAEMSAQFDHQMRIPNNFERTAPPFDGDSSSKVTSLAGEVNPQTSLLCDMLDLIHPNHFLMGGNTAAVQGKVNKPVERGEEMLVFEESDDEDTEEVTQDESMTVSAFDVPPKVRLIDTGDSGGETVVRCGLNLPLPRHST